MSDIRSFCYYTMDMSESDAKCQEKEAGWRSVEQLKTIWNFLRQDWNLETRDAREKLTDLSWKKKAVDHIPEDYSAVKEWWTLFYNTFDFSRDEAGERVYEMMMHEPEKLTDHAALVHDTEVFKELYGCSDLSKTEAGLLVARFQSRQQVEDLWKALYNTCDMSKSEATNLLADVRSWQYVEQDWIAKKWGEYYTRDRASGKAEAQEWIKQELVDWGKKSNNFGA